MRIIYVAGAAHCGSTLVDLFLGQHPAVLSAGQLSDIAWCVTEDGDIDKERIEHLHLETWADALLALSRAERSYLRASFRQITKEKKLLGFFFSRTRRKKYADGVVPLLRAVAEQHPEKSVIVDSSKNIARALALNELPDVVAVHLVRDGHGYVKSKLWRQEGAGSPVRVIGYALYWAVKNLAAAVMLKPLYGERCFRIRYEDFVSDPVSAVRPVLRAVGIDDLEPYKVAARDGIVGRPLLGGNRIRFLDKQKINPDAAKPVSLPKLYHLLFGLSAGAVRKLFGY